MLAAAGVGSRREIERWIAAGRLLVNGVVPEPGARLGEADRVTVDGRPVRLKSRAPDEPSHLLLLHRPPGTPLDLKEAALRAADHLGKSGAARRWLAINRLPPVDGGLELLTDDGALSLRISRAVHALTMDYVLRVRGAISEELLRDLRDATEVEGEPVSILEAEAQLGEGQNHWLQITARATRPASIRHWLAARSIIVSRLMRIRLGPVHLGRDVPRGRLREVTLGERNALLNEVEAACRSAVRFAEQ